ncbi:MAG: tetratricopeptide repeat protein [Holosporales bacterium]
MPWAVLASDSSQGSYSAEEGEGFDENRDLSQSGDSPELTLPSREKRKRDDQPAEAEGDEDDTDSLKSASKRLKSDIAASHVEALVVPTMPKDQQELLQWIKAANAGDHAKQDHLVHLLYLTFLHRDIAEKLAFPTWSTDFEAWVMADLKRAYVIALFAPELLRVPALLMQKIAALAAANNPDACLAMGRFHLIKWVDQGLDPEILKANNVKAFHYFLRAAKQGNTVAMVELGMMLEWWNGVNRGECHASDADPIQWYRRAAEQGNAYAMNNFAVKLEEGKGVAGGQCPENDVEAVKLYQQAAEQGFTLAMSNLVCMLEAGRGVPGGQCPDNDAKAFWWTYSMAELGCYDSMCVLANHYEEGSTVVRDLAESCYWAIKSNNGDNKAGNFILNTEAPLEAETSEEPDNSDLNNLQKKVHDLAGEYSLNVMKHDPIPHVSDAMQAGRLPKMPTLAELYRPLSALLTQTANLVEALEKPGILVNIIQRNSQEDLVIGPDNLEPGYGEWTLPAEGVAGRLFAHGRDNVRDAGEIMDLISCTHPLWVAAQASLQQVEKVQQDRNHALWVKYENLEAEYKALESNLSMLQAMPDPSLEQREKVVRLTVMKNGLMNKIELYSHMEAQLQVDRERLQAVRALPEELKIAVISDLGRRNARFKQDHPWIDQLDDEFSDE